MPDGTSEGASPVPRPELSHDMAAGASTRSSSVEQGPALPPRRKFLSTSTAVMAGSLVLGYGAFFGISGAFLYPRVRDERDLVFVSTLKDFQPGSSLTWTAPSGAKIVITRRGATGGVSDFVALSDVCPHLGCKVHWEPANNRFFCPCHNGVFDPSGKPLEGPPAEAGTPLIPYELAIVEGALFARLPKRRAF